MSLSTQRLKDEFKSSVKKWDSTLQRRTVPDAAIVAEIRLWGEFIEQSIQGKVQRLENDFKEFVLKGEYLRTVNEGFDDLNRLFRTQKTFLDIAESNELTHVLYQIKRHYTHYIVPLLNIISKLENDYVSIITQLMTEKKEQLSKIDEKIKTLKQEKQKLKHNLFSFNKKKKFINILHTIHHEETNKKIIQLFLHHIKLNLYYFNQDRPSALQAVKENADSLGAQLNAQEGTTTTDLTEIHALLKAYEKSIQDFQHEVIHFRNQSLLQTLVGY